MRNLLALALILVPGLAWANTSTLTPAGASDDNQGVEDNNPTNGCSSFTFSSSLNTADSVFLTGGRQIMVISFEPDIEGSNTDGQVDLFICTSTDGDGDGTKDTDGCRPLNWSVDGGAYANHLDGVTDGRQSWSGRIAGWFYLDPTAGTGVSQANVCGFTN